MKNEALFFTRPSRPILFCFRIIFLIFSRLPQFRLLCPKTAKALLTQFKSVGAVKEATPDQLENTPGVGKQLAQIIYEYFHQE